MALTKTTTALNPIKNFIVWHRGECNIFKGETAAMDFIYAERYKDPNVSFNGWRESLNGGNVVTVLSGYNEPYMLDKAAATLMPRRED